MREKDFLLYQRFRQILRIFVLVSIVVLASLIYYYPIRNHVPPGVDAAVYINDARWILAHHHLPPHQIITHGYGAYPSPGTEVTVWLLALLTGGSVVTIFAFYQLALIGLLVLTTYFVGTLFGRRLALLFTVCLIGSFPLYRLYIGSTISNLMAFSLINLIFYFSIKLSQAARKLPYIFLIGILFVLLYEYHSYLSAPIFLGVYLVYLVILTLTNTDFRTHAWLFFQQTSRWILGIAAVAIVATVVVLLYKYHAIALEAQQAFFGPATGDKFQYVVTWKTLDSLLGQPIWNLALLGILGFIVSWKKNIRTWRVFPLLWLLVLWVLLQSYKLGVHFYFERLAFLAAVTVPFFAALTFRRSMTQRWLTPVVIMLLVITMTTSGVNYMVNLFQSSNDLGDNQLAALRILAQNVKPTDLVFSNNNGVMQTRHDVIVTDANFKYFPSIRKSCPKGDQLCLAFTTPNTEATAGTLQSQAAYILLLKPNYESNADLDTLARKYTSDPSYQTLYTSSQAYLFRPKQP